MTLLPMNVHFTSLLPWKNLNSCPDNHQHFTGKIKNIRFSTITYIFINYGWVMVLLL